MWEDLITSQTEAARDRFRASGYGPYAGVHPQDVRGGILGSPAIEPVSALREEGAAGGCWEYEQAGSPFARHQIRIREAESAL